VAIHNTGSGVRPLTPTARHYLPDDRRDDGATGWAALITNFSHIDGSDGRNLDAVRPHSEAGPVAGGTPLVERHEHPGGPYSAACRTLYSSLPTDDIRTLVSLAATFAASYRRFPNVASSIRLPLPDDVRFVQHYASGRWFPAGAYSEQFKTFKAGGPSDSAEMGGRTSPLPP